MAGKALGEGLTRALSEVALAEAALESALRELRSGPRAEKVTVSSAVEDAFSRVRAARAALAALRDQLDEAPV